MDNIVTPEAAVHGLVQILRNMKPGERKSILSLLEASTDFCWECGYDFGDRRQCFCWNDE